MAKYKAIRSFCGKVTMKKGAVKEINDQDVAQDLIKAGFVVALDSAKPEKAEKPVEADEKLEETPAPKKAGRKPKKEGNSNG